MSELKPLHKDNTVEVPRRVWNQVEGRLNNSKQKKKLLRLKVISGLAACLLGAFVLSYVSFETGGNRDSFARNGQYKSMVFENLDSSDSELYDFDQVTKLKVSLVNSQPSFGRRNRSVSYTHLTLPTILLV